MLGGPKLRVQLDESSLAPAHVRAFAARAEKHVFGACPAGAPEVLFLDRGAEGPRTIENANETLAALQTLPGFRVAMVRMEHLSLRDQWSLHDFHDMARKIACHKSCSGKNRRFLRNVTNVAEFIGIFSGIRSCSLKRRYSLHFFFANFQ